MCIYIQTLFKSCVDAEHCNTYEGMPEHGHYITPIKSGSDVLGVMVVYLDEDHLYNDSELSFLQRAANVIGIAIKQYRSKMLIERLSIAIEQSPVSILITDSQGNIEYINSACTQLTGYEREEVIGNKPSLFKRKHSDPSVSVN